MFDIFTKSKIEFNVETPGYYPVRPCRLGSAWRVYRALDWALKAGELERALLVRRIGDATAVGAASLISVDGEPPDAPNLYFLDEPIQVGIDRANRLDGDMACYKFLKRSLLDRFPELEPNDVR